MKLPHPLSPGATTAVCALLLATSSPAHAQAPAVSAGGLPPSPVASVSVTPPPTTPVTGRRVDLEFSSETLESVASKLMEYFPEENFIVPASIGNVLVTMRLRKATLGQALTAISLATENRILATSPETGLNTFCATGALIPPPPSCRIYSLANYLSQKPEGGFNQAIDELMVVLKKAAQHLNAASPGAQVTEPRLEFHQPTKLLIAVGTEPELAILTQIVQALEGTAPNGMIGGSPGSGGPGLPGGMPGNFSRGNGPAYPGAPSFVAPPPLVPGLGGGAPAAPRR